MADLTSDIRIGLRSILRVRGRERLRENYLVRVSPTEHWLPTVYIETNKSSLKVKSRQFFAWGRNSFDQDFDKTKIQQWTIFYVDLRNINHNNAELLAVLMRRIFKQSGQNPGIIDITGGISGNCSMTIEIQLYVGLTSLVSKRDI